MSGAGVVRMGGATAALAVVGLVSGLIL